MLWPQNLPPTCHNKIFWQWISIVNMLNVEHFIPCDICENKRSTCTQVHTDFLKNNYSWTISFHGKITLYNFTNTCLSRKQGWNWFIKKKVPVDKKKRVLIIAKWNKADIISWQLHWAKFQSLPINKTITYWVLIKLKSFLYVTIDVFSLVFKFQITKSYMSYLTEIQYYIVLTLVFIHF